MTEATIDPHVLRIVEEAHDVLTSLGYSPDVETYDSVLTLDVGVRLLERGYSPANVEAYLQEHGEEVAQALALILERKEDDQEDGA